MTARVELPQFRLTEQGPLSDWSKQYNMFGQYQLKFHPRQHAMSTSILIWLLQHLILDYCHNIWCWNLTWILPQHLMIELHLNIATTFDDETSPEYCHNIWCWNWWKTLFFTRTICYLLNEILLSHCVVVSTWSCYVKNDWSWQFKLLVFHASCLDLIHVVHKRGGVPVLSQAAPILAVLEILQVHVEVGKDN